MADENPGADATPKKKPRFEPPTLDAATLKQLEEQHEDVLVLRGPAMSPWVVALRRPTRQESIAYKTHARKEGQNTTANEALVRRVAVFPKDSILDAQVARWPFLCDGIVDSHSFKEFIGVTADADLKG